MKHKEYLRNVLVQKGYAQSTDEAERMILANKVRVDGESVVQAGAMVPESAVVEVSEGSRYASRGGYKLEGALKDFEFDVRGLCCIDAGASTGGFTDCLLQRGAAHVVSVDVGYGQFDWKLRQDTRITLFERTHIAKVAPDTLGAPFDLLVADLSFTSLARLAEVFALLIHEEGDILTLVKPQFELPKAAVKNGVVKSLDLHIEALVNVSDAYAKAGLATKALSYSPLLGPKGNIEFWIWASKRGATATINAEQIVRMAHDQLRP